MAPPRGLLGRGAGRSPRAPQRHRLARRVRSGQDTLLRGTHRRRDRGRSRRLAPLAVERARRGRAPLRPGQRGHERRAGCRDGGRRRRAPRRGLDRRAAHGGCAGGRGSRDVRREALRRARHSAGACPPPSSASRSRTSSASSRRVSCGRVSPCTAGWRTGRCPTPASTHRRRGPVPGATPDARAPPPARGPAEPLPRRAPRHADGGHGPDGPRRPEQRDSRFGRAPGGRAAHARPGTRRRP